MIHGEMDSNVINVQYKCVKNSIVHRPNSTKMLNSLDKYYNELFA